MRQENYFSQIDYLDKNRPLVVVQSASILDHDSSYAVDVLDAVDVNRIKLVPTPGLQALFASKSEVKHVRSYNVNCIPKIDTGNEILCQQNEAITFENDELANDLYNMIQENEEMVVNLERVECNLLNSIVLVQNSFKGNEC